MTETTKPSDVADIIGGFPYVNPNCAGCGKPLRIDNAWMTDGCPCNHTLGINNQNETRWRLLMMLHQRQQHELAAYQGTDPRPVVETIAPKPEILDNIATALSQPVVERPQPTAPLPSLEGQPAGLYLCKICDVYTHRIWDGKDLRFNDGKRAIDGQYYESFTPLYTPEQVAEQVADGERRQMAYYEPQLELLRQDAARLRTELNAIDEPNGYRGNITTLVQYFREDGSRLEEVEDGWQLPTAECALRVIKKLREQLSQAKWESSKLTEYCNSIEAQLAEYVDDEEDSNELDDLVDRVLKNVAQLREQLASVTESSSHQKRQEQERAITTLREVLIREQKDTYELREQLAAKSAECEAAAERDRLRSVLGPCLQKIVTEYIAAAETAGRDYDAAVGRKVLARIEGAMGKQTTSTKGAGG